MLGMYRCWGASIQAGRGYAGMGMRVWVYKVGMGGCRLQGGMYGGGDGGGGGGEAWVWLVWVGGGRCAGQVGLCAGGMHVCAGVRAAKWQHTRGQACVCLVQV